MGEQHTGEWTAGRAGGRAGGPTGGQAGGREDLRTDERTNREAATPVNPVYAVKLILFLYFKYFS